MKWVRPLVIVSLTGAMIWGFVAEKVGTVAFATFATGLIVYWFKSRDEEKEKK